MSRFWDQVSPNAGKEMLRSSLPVIALAFTPAFTAPRCELLACRCTPVESTGQTPTQFVHARRERAERVALGRVVRLDTLHKVSWGTGSDAVTIRPIVAHIRVKRVWRGPLSDTMTVMVTTLESRSTCDLELRPGATYLIFAARTEGGPLATRKCSGTEEERTAADALAALGPGQPVRP